MTTIQWHKPEESPAPDQQSARRRSNPWLYVSIFLIASILILLFFRQGGSAASVAGSLVGTQPTQVAALPTAPSPGGCRCGGGGAGGCGMMGNQPPATTPPATTATVKSVPSIAVTDTPTTPTPSNEQEIQEISMSVESGFYSPSTFTVRADIPVRWMIDATRMSGCTSTLVAKSLGIRQALNRGTNVIEFTPQSPGTIPFSCGMGMVRGSITVE